MIDKKELLHVLALRGIPGVGDATAKQLILKFGSAHDVFRVVSEGEKKNISEKLINYICNPEYLKKAADEINFIEKHQIDYWYFQDSDYPYFLRQCNDCPVILFYRGRITLRERPIISIVGTRKNTSHSVDFLEHFFKEIAPFDPIIVSGLAYGIDITAHRLAIEHQLMTIACLGHGLDQIYPTAHKKYCEAIEANGAFVTDFCSDKQILPVNFIRRNRIIAGISQATIVVESAIKGGAITTANMAFSYDRDVFAIPGRPSDVYSGGCNALIKNQKAQLLNNAEELITTLKWSKKKQSIVRQELFVELDPYEQQLYDYLKPLENAQFDEIIRNCGMSTSKVSSTLLRMELKGIVKTLPGKLFRLI